MRRGLMILLLLVCSLPRWAVAWEGHASSVGMVYVPAGEEKLSADVARMAEEEKARLVPLLGVRKPQWFPIYVYTDHSAFMRDSALNPDLLGESYQPTGLIRIYAGGAEAEGILREVLAHEMVHSLINERLGPHIAELPVWVNEGTATLYADHVGADDYLSIAQWLQSRDGSLTIEQLETAFATGKSVDTAYQQSRSMVAWLEYRHPGALNAIFDQLNDGHEFESALIRATGLSENDWLRQWQQGIPRYLIWENFALNILGSPVIFAPLGILLAIAFIIKIARKKSDEDEEDEEAEDDDMEPPGASPPVSVAGGTRSLAQYPIWDDIRSTG